MRVFWKSGLGGRKRSAVDTQFKEAALRCQLCSCMTERERLLKLCTPDASLTSPHLSPSTDKDLVHRKPYHTALITLRLKNCFSRF